MHMSSTPDAQSKIADIMQWVGSDAFWYLTIREVFLKAERENITEITDALDKFHAICKKTMDAER